MGVSIDCAVRADMRASLSTALFCGFWLEWPLAQRIATLTPTRRTALMSSFHSYALTTGFPLLVYQPLLGQVYFAVEKLSATYWASV